MKIAVSACLMGRDCKYDGGNNFDERLMAWLEACESSEAVEVVEVCPEVEGGLPTPRVPSELRDGRVVNAEGVDVTAAFELGAQRCLEKTRGCDLVVLKAKSPSCGVHQVYDGSFGDRLVPGKGVFAALLEKEGVHVVEPDDLELCSEVCEEFEADGLQDDFEDGPALNGPALDGDNLRVFPQAMFGKAYVYDVETEDGDPVRLLEVGGVFESATYLDHRRFEPTFEYYRSFDHLFEAFPQPDRVLMLGGGGFAYPKHFIASQPHGGMDVVEIDPVITRIAHELFFLDELIETHRTKETGRLKVATADARSFVEDCVAEGVLYSAVINDSFSGETPTASLMDEEGLKAVKKCLVEDGLYLINVICDTEEDATSLLEVARALRAEFAHVHVIPCVDEVFGDEDNNLVIATDGDYEFSGCLPPLDEDLLALR